ncbi:MAG: sigma factor-like helix-turn-helix DNA-binding protein [Phycisphaerales bacterium JB039]
MKPVRDDLQRAITRLPREQRLALLLSYADELSIDEIATVMRISADDAQDLLLGAVESVRDSVAYRRALA